MDPRLGSAARLQKQKKYAEAEQVYRQILRNRPRDPDALLLMGLLLHETGRSPEAVESLRRAITAQPGRPEVHQTLVTVLMAMGNLPEAVTQAKEVVRLRPMIGASHYAVGHLLLQSGEFAAALPYARRATELERSAVFLLMLSRILVGLGSDIDAMKALDQGLSIDSKNADVQIDKAQLLQKAGQLDQAISLFESALKLNAVNASAWNNLGSCYLLKTRTADAIRCFETAAALLPQSPVPPNNVGAALKEAGRIDEAIEQFKKSLELKPNYVDAHCNLGGAYAAIGEPHRAIDAFREAIRIDPSFAGVGSNLLMSTLSPPDLTQQQVFDEHRMWEARHSTKPMPAINRPASKRIRIGYVSPDFREHSVRYFIEPVLAAHNKEEFEVHCYAAGQRRDEVSDRLSKLVDGWHPISHLSDMQLVEMLRSHGIDILVDLAGHTSDNRLPAFALKPAAVQVTYLGYPTTTGMAAMDYRLTDAICDPPGADQFYTEKLVRLPHAFFVYGDDLAKSYDPTLPADRNGHFTFGSFNSFTKFNDGTLHSWANILHAVPGSRLLIKAKPIDNPSTHRRVMAFFTERGIASDRLDLRSWVPLAEHTALLGRGIDLMLDTFPYNGHTTSCQSIWMGAPVVTRSGETFRSRVGQVIMRNLDLMDFVASTCEDYEKTAIALATDLTRLREIRPTLRERFAKSRLCDAKGFVTELEAAYRTMGVSLTVEALF